MTAWSGLGHVSPCGCLSDMGGPVSDAGLSAHAGLTANRVRAVSRRPPGARPLRGKVQGRRCGDRPTKLEHVTARDVVGLGLVRPPAELKRHRTGDSEGLSGYRVRDNLGNTLVTFQEAGDAISDHSKPRH